MAEEMKEQTKAQEERANSYEANIEKLFNKLKIEENKKTSADEIEDLKSIINGLENEQMQSSNRYRNRGGRGGFAAPPPLFGYVWDVFDFILILF